MGKGVFQQDCVLYEESRQVRVSSNKIVLSYKESRQVSVSSNKIVCCVKTVGG